MRELASEIDRDHRSLYELDFRAARQRQPMAVDRAITSMKIRSLLYVFLGGGPPPPLPQVVEYQDHISPELAINRFHHLSVLGHVPRIYTQAINALTFERDFRHYLLSRLCNA